MDSESDIDSDMEWEDRSIAVSPHRRELEFAFPRVSKSQVQVGLDAPVADVNADATLSSSEKKRSCSVVSAFHSMEEFYSAMTHIVLPSKITNRGDRSLLGSTFTAILSAVVNTPNFGFEKLIPNTCRCTQLWKLCLTSETRPRHCYESNQRLCENSAEISKAITNIQAGDVLPFYFKSSDLAFLISKPKASAASSDSLVISWFQVSADINAVNSTQKLVTNYPEYSFRVPFSEFIKSKEFAEKLVGLRAETTLSSDKSQAYANTTVEWVTLTLLGSENPILNICHEFPSIQMSLKDEALENGFRRAGCWTTIKVALHFLLVGELGEANGKIFYKLIMVQLICRIIIEHQIYNGRSSEDIGMDILTKLARKIDKVKTRFTIVDPKLQEIQTQILDGAIELMQKTGARLKLNWDRRISEVQELKDVDKKRRGRVEPIYEQQYIFGENRLEYLMSHIENRKSAQEELQFNPEINQPDRPSGNMNSPSPFEVSRDFEISLWEKEENDWKPLELRDQIIKYIDVGCKSFQEDPLVSSRVILTLLRGLQILDQLAVSQFPTILNQHKLFDFDMELVIRSLLLVTREDVERANTLEIYFKKRKEGASYPSLIAEAEPSGRSPAVRIAQTHLGVRELKQKLTHEIDQAVAQLRKQMEDFNNEYNELAVKFRNEPCRCPVETYTYNRICGTRVPNHSNVYSCPKGAVKREMNGLKLSQFVYPIPIRSDYNQNAHLFELLLPAEVEAARDILFLAWSILSPPEDDGTVQGRHQENYDSCYTERIQRAEERRSSRIFHLGRKSVSSHTVKFPISSLEQLLVRNEEVKYVWNSGVCQSWWTSYQFTREARPRICTNLKLGINSSYSNLEDYIHGSTHSQNQVLSIKGKCDPRLQVAEFVEFGTVRAGNRLQYRNICRTISTQSLSFSKEVFVLICQSIWQVGPLDEKETTGSLRDNHADLRDNSFVEEFLACLEKSVEIIRENMMATFAMLTVVVLTNRILEFNQTDALQARAIKLIRKCRDVLETWITELTSSISEHPKGSEGIKQNIIGSAICGVLTYGVSQTVLTSVLKTKTDAAQWLNYMAVIHDQVELGTTSSGRDGLIKLLLDFVRNIAYAVRENVDATIGNNFEILDKFVKNRTGYTFGNLDWASAAQAHLYSATYEHEDEDADDKVPLRSGFRINVTTGEFLENGSPTSKLPLEILRSEDYIRIFGNVEMRVRSIGVGRKYRTNNPIKGCHYEFQIREENHYRHSKRSEHEYFSRYAHVKREVIITEKRGTQTSELVKLEVLRAEIPFLLVDEFSHWWNKDKNTVEFRPKSFENEFFLNPTYELHLNTRDLLECSTKNIMTNVGDGVHDKIIHILKRIELPKYMLLWKQDGEIVVKLPRYGLTFKWEKDHLVCPEYNEMWINPNFQLCTLIGLEQYIILEDSGKEEELKTRKVLVPHGDVGVGQGNRVIIAIDTPKFRNPPYFIFQVEETLRRLTAGQSTAAWLYLATLHAMTTWSLVDPFTGLTGLEMAVHILQSCHCRSAKPYDEESLVTLQFINDLSPVRKRKERMGSNKTKQILQDLSLSSGMHELSLYARYDGYHLIVKKLYQDSMKVGFLFGKSREILAEDGRDDYLMRRGYWRSISSYNQAAWIKSDFLTELAIPTTQRLKFRLKFPISTKLKNLHIMAALTHDWETEMNSEYKGSLTKLIYNGDNLEGLKPSAGDDFRFLTPSSDIRDYWIQLYGKALEVGKNRDLQSKWTLLMCGLAYQKNIELTHLLLLHTIAANFEKFPEVPQVKSYCSVKTKGFVRSVVEKLLEAKRNSHYNIQRYGDEYYRMDYKAREEATKKWEKERDLWISEQLDKIELYWNEWDKSNGDSETRQPLIISIAASSIAASEFLDSAASQDINKTFAQWEDNLKLSRFIAKVEDSLVSCITNTTHHVLSWQVPDSDQFRRAAHGSCSTIFDFYLPQAPFPGIHSESEIDVPCLYNQLVHQTSDEQIEGLKPRHSSDRIVREHSSSVFSRGVLQECKNESKVLWKLLDSSWRASTKESYYQPAGIFPRIVPLTVLPLILADGSPELKELVITTAVVWTLSQRAVRILKYLKAGESREVQLKREIETRGHGNWDPKTYPEWIILELEMNLMIRDVQVDVAENMLSGNEESSVTQLNMGEGKTSVIVPMLVSTLAKTKESCVRVTVLKSLYETNFKDLSRALGGILNQRVHLFPCNRDLELTSNQVDLILELHRGIRSSRGVVLTIPEYRLSWELRAYESAGKDETICRKFMNLVNWIHANARDVLDESDEILSVKYQKVYALGISEKIEELNWKVAQRLLKSIPVKLEVLKKKYKICIEMETTSGKGRSQAKEPSVYKSCRLLNYTEESEQCYQELIRELASEFIELEFGNTELHGHLMEFLTDPSFGQGSYDHLATVCVQEGDAVLAKKFAKAKIMAELLVNPGVLQSCLSKRWRVNYGVHPNIWKSQPGSSNGRRIAVPFRAKDVAHEKTEFGHPAMAIILTQLSYYYSGLNDDQLTECFHTLERNIENPTVEYDSWMSTIGDERKPRVAYSAINLEYSKQRTSLFKVLRKNVNVVDFWLSHCVFPKEVRRYPDKITCSAWDLCFGEKRTVGFSGTNDMARLLPKWIKPKDLKILSKTNEQVEAAVEQSENYQCLPSWIATSTEILQTLYENDVRVLMDAGALMTDATNARVADEWLKIDKKVEAVVFFNDENQLTARNREKIDTPFELSPFSEKLDQCAVYLDDEHTRGTDLRFPDGTIGCVTLGGRMTRDKLVQACLRLRLLQSGHHKLFFLASREAHNQVISLMAEDEDEPTAKDVLSWVIHNNEEYIKEGLVFWANSGLNFARKRSAVLNFLGGGTCHDFGNQVQDGGGDLRSDASESFPTQQTFVLILPEMFEQSKQKYLDTIPNLAVNAGISQLFSELEEYILDLCLKLIPTYQCFSNNLEEEQEREIEQEIEMEVNVSRPPPAHPHAPQLHPSIKEFIITGIFNPTRMEIEETPFKGLFASKDFLRVASSRMLRPVNWVSTSPSASDLMLLLSPFEVNALILEYRHGTPKANIHMFAPRLRQDQPILIMERRLQLGATVQNQPLLPGQALARLHMFAGSLYFDPERRDEEENCYEFVAKEMQNKKSEFNLVTFIGKNIEERHQHFPEKSDVHIFLKW